MLSLIVCLRMCPWKRYIRSLDVDVAGFTELNGWMDDTSSVNKARHNPNSLTWLSGQAGLPFAQFLTVPSGYHIGEGQESRKHPWACVRCGRQGKVAAVPVVAYGSAIVGPAPQCPPLIVCLRVAIGVPGVGQASCL
jgi:hypothetical protein